jgi:NAD(P)-dependent dehydrogenase (short-subunit alcohol dehydrogenase family)
MISAKTSYQASAIVWARAGAEGIALAGRRLEKLEETASQIRALKNGSKTKVLAVPTDVTKDADVANLFAQTVKTFGRSPDVVLSNAGAVEVGPMGEQGVDVWWGILVCCMHDSVFNSSDRGFADCFLTRAST